MTMKTSEFLRNAKTLIDSPEKWCTLDCAQDTHRLGTSPADPNAVCFCSLGALARASLGSMEYYSKGHDTLQSVLSPNLISHFNDTHTHAEVMLAWDKAIALAESEGD